MRVGRRVHPGCYLTSHILCQDTCFEDYCLLTDGNGIPLGLSVDGANSHDKKMAEGTIESIVVDRPEPTSNNPQNMCLDKGYDL